MFEVICISFAFFFGLVVRRAALPPLVGFLAAGFAISALGQRVGLPPGSGEVLGHISHLGVLLLLFTVGLKLRLGQILQPQVLGSALAHVVIWSLGLVAALVLAAGLDARTALLLGVALAFSSTVFSAKTIEAKRDTGTFYGRTTIGILVVQDLDRAGGAGDCWRQCAQPLRHSRAHHPAVPASGVLPVACSVGA